MSEADVPVTSGEECVKQDDWYSQCKPAKVKGTVDRLCIFDFDDTIKVGVGRRIEVGRDAKAIIDKCREMGYGVAIASASCETDFQKAAGGDSVHTHVSASTETCTCLFTCGEGER